MKIVRSSLFAFAVGLTFLAHAQKSEAENGVLTGTNVSSSRSGYSGSGYVEGFDEAGDAVTMEVDVSSAGLYEVWVGYSTPNGEKTNDIYVNDEFVGSQYFPETNSFTEGLFGKVSLNKGVNTIKVQYNWGWFEVDYVRVEPASRNATDNYPEELNNPNATYEADIVYRYIRDLYGHRILSGQQADAGGSEELNYLQAQTGKLPALKGFDLIDYSPSRVERGTTSQETERSVEWWEEGGIVSMLWHWNAPKDLIDEDGAEWWNGFYTYATTFDPSIAMEDNQSEEYELIIRDIDAIADELKQIQSGNTPLLWRPLHEAEGGWFWWGAYGSETCVWLWKLMYDRLTVHHGLNNLIWVWTGTDNEEAMDWYPGDDYVDIVGADIYLDDGNYTASFPMFDNMAGIHEGGKILTLSETGTIPDPDALESEKAGWSWFCTWSGDFILGGDQNELDHINKVYNHNYVITLDELPNFYNYVSPEFEDDPLSSPIITSSDVKIYPNPTRGIVYIEGSKIEKVIVYDYQGKILMSFQESIPEKLNFTNYPQGIYLVRVISEGKTDVFRINRFN